MDLIESSSPKEQGSPVQAGIAHRGWDDELPFQFITSTGQTPAGESDLAARRLVRAQARRSAHRKNESATSALKANTDSSRRAQDLSDQFHTSRFKLTSWQRKSRKKKGTVVSQHSKATPLELDVYGLEIDSPRLQAGLGVINVLPIPLTPMTEKILYFYHVELQTNSLALNPERNWYSFAKTDAALLHALLSTVAALRNHHLGSGDQTAVVHHRSEAVRLINQQLAEGAGPTSHMLIVAVSVLVTAEAIESNWDRALIHMRGLARMVELRGGLRTLDHCQVTQRIIAWADFCFSSTWDMPLSFPLLPSFSQSLIQPGPLAYETLVQYAQFGSSSDILEPNLAVLNSLAMLQALSRTIVAYPYDGGDRLAISNSIYVVEYQLLTQLQSLKISPVKNAVGPVDISECLALSGLLYLHLAIRELPLLPERHRRLIQRLVTSLPYDHDLLLAVAPEMGLCLLLWALSIGATIFTEPPLRSSILERMVEVNAALSVSDYENFESRLKRILWMDGFCGLRSAALWDEIWLGHRLSEL